MLENITAVYEKGCLRPLQPLNLQENEIVHLTVLEKVVAPKEVIFQANLPERKESPINIKKYRGLQEISGRMLMLILMGYERKGKMELAISDEKTKELLTEVIIEMIKQKREIFYDIILEALEEVGLAKAIVEGRKNDFVSEDKILSILEG